MNVMHCIACRGEFSFTFCVVILSKPTFEVFGTLDATSSCGIRQLQRLARGWSLRWICLWMLEHRLA